MNMNNVKYFSLSEDIINRTYRLQNWKKLPIEIMKGEISILLNKHGIKHNESFLISSVWLVKIYSNNPSMFYLNSERLLNASKLGKIVHERTKNLSEPETTAENILKLWSSSQSEYFSEVHLTKILRYNANQNKPILVPLNDLFQLLNKWNFDKKKIITHIATDFYYHQTKDTK